MISRLCLKIRKWLTSVNKIMKGNPPKQGGTR
jgi:hypothetical protein